MTLQTEGAISLEQIRTEFGRSGSLAMNQLYKDGGIVASTATSTVGGSVANLTGSTVYASGDAQFGWKYAQGARFTSNMTCGGNGNVTANGNIVFTANGAGDGDNASFMTINAGIRVVHIDATTSSSGTLGNALHEYSSFNGALSSAPFVCSSVSTIPSGTNLQIPSGTTSFKILTYISVSKGPRGSDDYAFASASLNNPSSGAFTSTSTGNINTGVPTNGAISFQNFYGVTA